MKKEEFAKPTEAPKTEKEKNGYVIGAACAHNLLKQLMLGEDVESADMIKGFKDVLNEKALLSEDEIRNAVSDVMLKVNSQEHYKKMNEAFLVANVKKDGVKTTESGLQYKILVEGAGDIPKLTDSVNVYYTGRFINGIEFDSTTPTRRMSPANIPVNGVNPGWAEALQMMKSGSKWRLFVPAKLGYGSSQKTGMRPDSTLIFDIELVDIGAAKNAASNQNSNTQSRSSNQQQATK